MSLTTPVVMAQPGGSAIVTVHRPDVCEGMICALHSPTRHAMRDWPIRWRGQPRSSRRLERVCPHGVGHPDPDDYVYRALTRGLVEPAAFLAHPCCDEACCS